MKLVTCLGRSTRYLGYHYQIEYNYIQIIFENAWTYGLDRIDLERLESTIKL